MVSCGLACLYWIIRITDASCCFCARALSCRHISLMWTLPWHYHTTIQLLHFTHIVMYQLGWARSSRQVHKYFSHRERERERENSCNINKAINTIVTHSISAPICWTFLRLLLMFFFKPSDSFSGGNYLYCWFQVTAGQTHQTLLFKTSHKSITINIGFVGFQS